MTTEPDCEFTAEERAWGGVPMTTEPDKDVEAIDRQGFDSWAKAVLDRAADPALGTDTSDWWRHAAIKLAEKGTPMSSRLLTAEGERDKWQAAFASKQLYPISEMEQKLAACEIKLEDADSKLATAEGERGRLKQTTRDLFRFVYEQGWFQNWECEHGMGPDQCPNAGCPDADEWRIYEAARQALGLPEETG